MIGYPFRWLILGGCCRIKSKCERENYCNRSAKQHSTGHYTAVVLQQYCSSTVQYTALYYTVVQCSEFKAFGALYTSATVYQCHCIALNCNILQCRTGQCWEVHQSTAIRTTRSTPQPDNTDSSHRALGEWTLSTPQYCTQNGMK